MKAVYREYRSSALRAKKSGAHSQWVAMNPDDLLQLLDRLEELEAELGDRTRKPTLKTFRPPPIE